MRTKEQQAALDRARELAAKSGIDLSALGGELTVGLPVGSSVEVDTDEAGVTVIRISPGA